MVGHLRRDLTIFAVTLAACSVGVLVAMLALNLTGANDAPRPVQRVTIPELSELRDAVDDIRPSDLPPAQREALDETRELLESIEAGDTVIAPPATAAPTTTAVPQTTTTEGEPSVGTRLLPLPDFAAPGYTPPTTEVSP